jgi:hypothetical protein
MDAIAERDEPADPLDYRSQAALRRSRRMSGLLDEAVRVPGTDYRVGVDPLLGLVPFGGDTVALVLSLYPILEAARLGLPRTVLARMLVNVGLDFVVGSVPVLGTLFDAVWKANERNVRLMEGHLE